MLQKLNIECGKKLNYKKVEKNNGGRNEIRKPRV
jgi:hypothetical protein